MATIDHKEWHPHVGSIWARYVALWELYVVDTTKTWAISYTTLSGYRCLKVTITGATDTDIWWLGDLSLESGIYGNIVQTVSYPGWRVMPKILEPTYGARNTITDYGTNIRDVHKDLFAVWTNATGTARNDLTFTTDVYSIDQRISYWIMRYRNIFVPDHVCGQFKVQSATEYYYNDQPGSVGNVNASVAVVGGGGGGGGITDAQCHIIADPISELALNRFEVNVNHGAVTMTAGNGSIVEP